jgi:DivIVA domain-containing protein
LSPKRGTIGAVLWFWVVVLVALIGAVAIVASGRGDSMAEVYDDRPDASLPGDRPLTADDLRAVRLNTGVRGYRMDEVDALLARLEVEMLEREDRADVRVVVTSPDDPAEWGSDLPEDDEPGDGELGGVEPSDVEPSEYAESDDVGSDDAGVDGVRRDDQPLS